MRRGLLAKLIGVIVAATLLVACTTLSSEERTRLRTVAATPIYCTTGEDCNVKWDRVLLWITNNSHWKIRDQTDSLITTEGPFNTTYAAYSVNMVSLGRNREQIRIQLGCGSLFGCTPDTLQLKASFVQFVIGTDKPVKASTQSSTPTFGATVMAVTTQSLAQTLGLGAPHGVFVTVVESGGVAGRAGIQQGDVLLIYMDKQINTPAELNSAVADTAVGATVPIDIWRGGKEITLFASF
jgi:PDZ domain